MAKQKGAKLKPRLPRSMFYTYEMETVDGKILQQYNPDGTENTWKTLDPDKVVRITFTSEIPLLPKHSVLIDLDAGERFVKRFGRGILKARTKFQLAEYINCIETNRYRFWVFSNGNCLITRNDYEVYV